MIIDVFITVKESNMDQAYIDYRQYFASIPVAIYYNAGTEAEPDMQRAGYHSLVKQGFYKMAKENWPNKIYLWQDAPLTFKQDGCIRHEFGSGRGVITCVDPETEDGTGLYNFKALKLYAKNVLGDDWRKVANDLLAELTQEEIDALTPEDIDEIAKALK